MIAVMSGPIGSENSPGPPAGHLPCRAPVAGVIQVGPAEALTTPGPRGRHGHHPLGVVHPVLAALPDRRPSTQASGSPRAACGGGPARGARHRRRARAIARSATLDHRLGSQRDRCVAPPPHSAIMTTTRGPVAHEWPDSGRRSRRGRSLRGGNSRCPDHNAILRNGRSPPHGIPQAGWTCSATSSRSRRSRSSGNRPGRAPPASARPSDSSAAGLRASARAPAEEPPHAPVGGCPSSTSCSACRWAGTRTSRTRLRRWPGSRRPCRRARRAARSVPDGRCAAGVPAHPAECGAR